jgi:hypothetical protein
MTKAGDRVIAGYSKLSALDKMEVVTEINRLNNASATDKQILDENFSKRAGIDPGPINTDGCPCCGKR